MKKRIDYLVSRWSDRSASDEERTELLQLLSTPVYTEEFKQSLDQVWFNMQVDRQMEEETAQAIFDNITGGKLIKMPVAKKRFKIYRIAAAAAIILIVLSAIILYQFSGAGNEETTTTAQTANDVEAPKNTRAVIRLADGRKIYLDSAGNGTLATQKDIKLIKNADGEIVYEGSGSAGMEISYNELFNPRGSKPISLTLVDGTKVWLNSESSLKYPTVFMGDAREVEITGEAYFEVAKNPGKKFVVTGSGARTEVLGTHFNVNTYGDEDQIKVTLLEGSVKVIATALLQQKGNNSSVMLKPGQQASLVIPGAGEEFKLRTSSQVNIEEVMAWKNNQFYFISANIRTIMSQLARWYDVEVEYDHNITNHFTGYISRSVNASEVFKMLEHAGDLKFIIKGKKVVVTR